MPRTVTATSGPGVLIVEDDESTLRGLQLLVEAEGFEVRLASCLREARDHLEDMPPDILLSDIVLPDGVGTELLDEIDEERTAVILVTGRRGVEIAHLATKDGRAREYLRKPIDIARLRALLGKLRHDPRAPRRGAEPD